MAASADPLELDRLAEELAEREGNSKSSEPINHDLPLPLPSTDYTTFERTYPL